MQPAQTTGADGGTGGNRQLKRWGPIIGVAVVVAIGGIVLAVTRGDDTKDSSSTTVGATVAVTTSPGATDATGSTEPGATDTSGPAQITYPLSFTDATDQGLADSIDWGDRCDTTTGRVKVPDFFAGTCFAPFSGDNGGATSTGVTADEITIVNYLGIAGDPIIAYVTDAVKVDDTNAQRSETMQGLVDFYQQYSELYGRKVKLINFEGTGIANDDVSARADAALIAEQYKPFVVFGGPSLTSAFADELAARKVMCIGCTPGQPDQFYIDRDPYVWGLDGSASQKRSHVLEFVTKQLIGRNATHAGPEFIDTPRTFGFLYLDSSGSSKDLADATAQAMADAGAPFAETVVYALDPTTIQATASQAIAKMKSAGVTTIVFNGDPVAPRDFTREATAQEYFPEWVVAASTLVDTNAFSRSYDQQQWAHAFGVTQLSVRTDPEKFGSFAVYQWFKGTPPPAPGSIAVMSPNPALFFAVAQGVGPNLTPETFRDALFASVGTTKAISQPYLTYGDKGIWPEKDYQGVDDATVFWWDATATGPDEIRKQGTGMWQFVDGGTRYMPGEWPSVDKLFDPTGAVALYTTPPPGEEPPSYPSPAG